MGKEWYHFGGGRSSSPSSTTCSSSSSSSSSSYPSYSKGRRGGGGREKEPPSSSSISSSSTTSAGGGGCMGAVFQLFDFHQFHFPLHHQPCFKFPSSSSHSFPELEEPSTVLKGTEAPRNSLDLGHDEPPLPSSSDMIRKDQHLLMPAVGMQVKTGREKMPSLPEISSSPGTKTPTLVARLMGLDLLPDSTSSSPRPSSTLDVPSLIQQSVHHSRTPHHRSSAGRKSCSDIVESSRGTRSLPETPRMSLGRRSDVDHHHRSSLHINRENNASRTVVEDFDFFRFRKELKCSLAEDGTSRSPSHYARQIVKQVKESISRRVGMKDITNTIRSRPEQGSTSKDQIPKPKKPSRNSRMMEDSSLPCPPRLSFPADTYTIQRPHSPKVQAEWSNHSGDANSKLRTKPQCSSNAGQDSSCPKLGPGDERVRRPARLAATEFMRNKQLEEPFVHPASKTTRTTHMNNIDTDGDKKRETTACGIRKRVVGPAAAVAAAAVLPVKRDPSPPATKIPHKQVHDIHTSRHNSQLSSCTSHRYCKEALPHTARDKIIEKPSGTAATITADTASSDRRAELQYVSEILQSAGIGGDTQVSSFTRWFSPSHPLDPSVFGDLERNSSTQSASLDHSCDRKLLFELVDELLAEFLKSYHSNDTPWINSITFYGRSAPITGSQLIDKLRAKFEGFPRADCQVLEDIDAIIDGDMLKSEVRSQRPAAVEAEGGGLASELELGIWEDLVREVVTEELEPAGSERTGGVVTNRAS